MKSYLDKFAMAAVLLTTFGCVTVESKSASHDSGTASSADAANDSGTDSGKGDSGLSTTDSGIDSGKQDGQVDAAPDTSVSDATVSDGAVSDSASVDAQPVDAGVNVFNPPTATPTSDEDFNATSTAWIPIQAAGGNFSQFAKVAGGELVVDVPAGNSWGKTGVRSEKPIFTISDDMAQEPYTLLVDFDPAATSGYVIALSTTAYDDIWQYSNAWTSFVRHPTAGGTSAALVNTQNASDDSRSLTNVPLVAPETEAVTVRPGHAQVCTSSGWAMEGKFGWLTTGTPVYAYVFSHAYDAAMPVKMAIKRIRVIRGGGCGPAGGVGTYTAAHTKEVFTDSFAGGVTQNFTPIQAAGGNYGSFAKTTTNELSVDVPGGNAWGKTGIRSSFFLFDVREDFNTTPLSITFAFDSSRTDGYVIALSPTAYDDIWQYSNAWTSFVRHPTAGGATASLSNTQNATDTAITLPNIPSEAPATTTMTVWPGHVQVCTSTGWGMEGDYAWLTPGTKVYAYVFSHAYESGMPVKMDLKSVAAGRTAGCGAKGSISAYPAPTPRQLFTDDFSGGYAKNWTGIQAAGGNFTSFATTTTGEVYVNVPAGNSWGKTGIRSTYDMFNVRSDFDSSPLVLNFTFDPARTTGYRVVLSETAYDDIWQYSNVWTGYIYNPDTGAGSFDLVNTQNTADTSTSLTTLPATAPETLTLTIKKKHVKAELSGGYVLEGDYAWLDVNKTVYVYVFSHPYAQGTAAKFALKSVRATR
jgi:hypothetical protein